MSLYSAGIVVLNLALVSCAWYAVWNMRIKKIPFVIKFFELEANSPTKSTCDDKNDGIPSSLSEITSPTDTNEEKLKNE